MSFVNKMFYPYHSLMKLRRLFYSSGVFRSEDLGVKVVSVGNLSMGGTGKTPFCLHLAKLFQENKMSPSILTRGYRSRVEKEGDYFICGKRVDESFVEKYGDEPTLYNLNLKDVPVVVGRNRRENFQKFRKNINTNVTILDDGLQHLKIKRDIDIVLLDAKSVGGESSLASITREFEKTIEEADYIFVTKSKGLNEKRKKMWSDFFRFYEVESKVAYCHNEYTFLKDKEEKRHELDKLRARDVVCVCALGRPDYFLRAVEDLGARIHGKVILSDHDSLGKKELDKIKKWAQTGKMIVMSEKDMVKFPAVDFNYYSLQFEIKFNKKGNQFLHEIIQKSVQ